MATLLYKVECKSTLPFFELIAAFNCQEAAEAYAVECAKDRARFDYRVKKGRRVLRDPNSCRALASHVAQGGKLKGAAGPGCNIS